MSTVSFNNQFFTGVSKNTKVVLSVSSQYAFINVS